MSQPSSQPIYLTWLPRKNCDASEMRLLRADDFPDLVRKIGVHVVQGDKGLAPQFTPSEWIEGTPDKSARYVQQVHFGVLDFDDVPADDFAHVLAKAPTAYLFMSSWSHGDPHKTAEAVRENPRLAKNENAVFLSAWGSAARESGGGGALAALPELIRGRLVVPFTKPVKAADWYRVWPHLARTFQHGLAVADENMSRLTSAYHMPGHPPKPFAPPIYLTQLHGPAWDVDWALNQPAPSPLQYAASMLLSTYQELRGPAAAKHDLTKHDLRQWAQQNARGKLADLARAAAAVCDGEPFAEAGRRESTLFGLMRAVAKQWPEAEPTSVIGLLEASLSRMGADAPTTAEAIEKLMRLQANERSRRGNAEPVTRFFRGRRDTQYSDEELKAFEQQHDTPSLRNRWIVQKGRSYYLLVGTPTEDGICTEARYRGAYSTEDILAAAHVLMAPIPGVQLQTGGAKNPRPKNSSELVKDYGTVVTKVYADLTADFSYLDEQEDAFIEAPCPLRDLEPRKNDFIDTWLRALAGQAYPRLAEWIAAVTLLNKPSSAVYFEGPPNTGKSLLAVGLSRLWTMHGPASFEECLGDFNDALLQCPLVFGDEVAPKDFRGQVRTGEIREFIQANQRPLKRKFKDGAKVKGCIRLILAANNRELLSSSEHLSTNDIAALVERFLYIYTQPEAAAYLKFLREKHYGEIESWVTQDKLAQHALYLRDTVHVRRDTRFLASGEASDFSRTLATSTGIRSAVCNWLVSFLLDPSKLAQHANRRCIRVYQGKIAINVQVLVDNWGTYPTNTPAPSARRIASAVSGLAIGDRVHLRDTRGNELYYRVIDTENLVTWAKDMDGPSSDAIQNAIRALDTPVIVKATAN